MKLSVGKYTCRMRASGRKNLAEFEFNRFAVGEQPL